MDELIEKIRAATAIDVSEEARARGAEACRTLLSVLDAKPGESLAVPSPPPEVALAAPRASPPIPQAAAQMIASALRGMTPDQLLDLAIARLRAALPVGTELAAPQPLKFHLVDIRR